VNWYRITFFKNEALWSEWKKFFEILLKEAAYVEIRVIYQNRKMEFVVGCTKKIDVLNSRLDPFFLADDLTDEENQIVDRKSFPRKMRLVFIDKDAFEFFQRVSLDGDDVFMVGFRISKYNPFRTLPRFKVVCKNEAGYYQAMAISLVHANAFLAFSLDNCISSEIAKVKPTLTNRKMTLALTNEGIINSKLWGEGKEVAVTSYDFWRHSLIIGQSGSGKSFAMKLMIDDIYKKGLGNEYAVVLVDPHASLDCLVGSEVGPRKAIDFKEISTNLFVNVGQPILSAELTMDLFSTVIGVRENQNLARVLKYSLTLLFSINKMNLENLKNLLTDSIVRKDFLKETSDENILKFFETEYQQIFSSQYATSILPVINIISELDFTRNAKTEVDLADEINNNFLLSFPIKQTELGKNITKVIGGAIIQQVFTLMQAGVIKKKVILMIDEVSVVQTPSLVHILSEARKFGLSVILAQQYMMQVSADVLQSIFANVVNYFVFKLARDDAETVARNLNFEIDEFFLKNKNDPREINELGVKILTDLNPREVVCRLMFKEEYNSPFKAKTINVNI
jgi:hypothetical protein